MKEVWIRIRALISEDRAQDLVEYALIVGLLTVATGATLPSAATNISQIFSKVFSVTERANEL